jgi:hypothetical protein
MCDMAFANYDAYIYSQKYFIIMMQKGLLERWLQPVFHLRNNVGQLQRARRYETYSSKAVLGRDSALSHFSRRLIDLCVWRCRPTVTCAFTASTDSQRGPRIGEQLCVSRTHMNRLDAMLKRYKACRNFSSESCNIEEAPWRF